MSVGAHVPNPQRKKRTVWVWFFLLFLLTVIFKSKARWKRACWWHSHWQTLAMCENCTRCIPTRLPCANLSTSSHLSLKVTWLHIHCIGSSLSLGLSRCSPSLPVVNSCVPTVMYLEPGWYFLLAIAINSYFRRMCKHANRNGWTWMLRSSFLCMEQLPLES